MSSFTHFDIEDDIENENESSNLETSNDDKPRAKYDRDLISSLRNNSQKSTHEGSSVETRPKYDLDFIASLRRVSEDSKPDSQVEDVTDQFKNCFITTNLHVKRPKTPPRYTAANRKSTDRRHYEDYDPKSGDIRSSPHSYNEPRNSRYRPQVPYKFQKSPYYDNYDHYHMRAFDYEPHPATETHKIHNNLNSEHSFFESNLDKDFVEVLSNQKVKDDVQEEEEWRFPSKSYDAVWGNLKRF